YVDPSHHRFVAPVRPKGDYAVRVVDAQGRVAQRGERILTYYAFADVTAAAGLEGGEDAWDATTSALADFDGDGDLDLFLARRGGPTTAGRAQTRVLSNDGHGRFTDVTARVLPPATASDDWRADKIALVDVDLDG